MNWIKTRNIIPDDLAETLGREFFELVPFNVCVIDRKFNIITANKNFEEYFGDWHNIQCFIACKKRKNPCLNCKIADVLATGKVAVSNESGIDRYGKLCYYVVHLAPLKDSNGKVKYIVEMSMDITAVSRYQREYNILFERVPSFITVIDKDFNIIRANKKFRDTFGDVNRHKCFEIYKKKKTKCKNCPTELTFKDGQDHVYTQVGLSQSGDETYYIVNTTPLSLDDEGNPVLVIEIATDITEVTNLQKQLKQAHDFYATLIENSTDGIIALNNKGKTEILNPIAKEILEWKSQKKPGVEQNKKMLPNEFYHEADASGSIAKLRDVDLTTAKGNKIPVRFNAVELRSGNNVLGRAAFIEDLRPLKKLEKEQIDAERLAAVGQTVAGLAHTIKNMLMGLEGGIYMVDTGLKKSDAERIFKGWAILQKNFDKTTALIKNFLSFSKGRLPVLRIIDPNSLVESIVELYRASAAKQGVELLAELEQYMKEAPLDPDGIEACLTNLLSNAIDAATLREDGAGRVIIRTKDSANILSFEVEDNGIGMDSEISQKIFTTFFTTKGGKGTGLGLLTTRKIVQEHGGKITVTTELDKGSTFTIRFPRERLYLIMDESLKSSNKI